MSASCNPRRKNGRRQALGLVAACLLLGVDGRAAQAELYASGSVSGLPTNLFVVNTATGTGTPVCQLDWSTDEIEYNNARQRAYMQHRLVPGPSGHWQKEFDIDSCASAGNPWHPGWYPGLEYVRGVLYGTSASPVSPRPSRLDVIDPDTNTQRVIGPTGQGPIVGLAWHEPSETLYGITGNVGSGPIDSELVTLDLATGFATVVGPSGFDVDSLEFGPDGELYAGGSWEDGGNLYRVDRATGAATLVGPTGYDEVNGLTLVGDCEGVEASQSSEVPNADMNARTAIGARFRVRLGGDEGQPAGSEFWFNCAEITVNCADCGSADVDATEVLNPDEHVAAYDVEVSNIMVPAGTPLRIDVDAALSRWNTIVIEDPEFLYPEGPVEAAPDLGFFYPQEPVVGAPGPHGTTYTFVNEDTQHLATVLELRFYWGEDWIEPQDQWGPLGSPFFSYFGPTDVLPGGALALGLNVPTPPGPWGAQQSFIYTKAVVAYAVPGMNPVVTEIRQGHAEEFTVDCSCPGFNLDLGDPALGVPASSYGAAAGLSGAWFAVDSSVGTVGLVDVDGETTGAVLTPPAAAGNFSFDNALTFGDDELLMDDLSDPQGSGAYVFSGLPDGSYTVYTYAWAPDDETFIVDIRVPGAAEGPQICGGPWPGAHQLGVTYTRHTTDVLDGELTVNCTLVSGPGSVNGFQLVIDDGGDPTPLGALDPACVPTPNSTGAPAHATFVGTGQAGDPLMATASSGPPANFGYFIAGPNPGLYLVPPGSVGVVCIAGPVFRYTSVPLGQIFQFDAGGVSQAVSGGGPSVLPTDGSSPGFPAVFAGQSWAFQGWYRDHVTSNFTDSTIIVFD